MLHPPLDGWLDGVELLVLVQGVATVSETNGADEASRGFRRSTGHDRSQLVTNVLIWIDLMKAIEAAVEVADACNQGRQGSWSVRISGVPSAPATRT